MAEEKTFTIPLRREFMKAPNYKRAKRATKALRSFLIRHMKGTEVKIGTHLNEKIWSQGLKSPPPRIKVKAIKEDNIIRVELPEFDFEKPKQKEEKKKEEKKPEAQKDLSLTKFQKEKQKEIKEIKKEDTKEIVSEEKGPKDKQKRNSKKETKKSS